MKRLSGVVSVVQVTIGVFSRLGAGAQRLLRARKSGKLLQRIARLLARTYRAGREDGCVRYLGGLLDRVFWCGTL
jgi:hypothetical protein